MTLNRGCPLPRTTGARLRRVNVIPLLERLPAECLHGRNAGGPPCGIQAREKSGDESQQRCDGDCFDTCGALIELIRGCRHETHVSRQGPEAFHGPQRNLPLRRALRYHCPTGGGAIPLLRSPLARSQNEPGYSKSMRPPPIPLVRNTPTAPLRAPFERPRRPAVRPKP